MQRISRIGKRGLLVALRKNLRLDESWKNKTAVDESRAIAIARRFLVQYHSPVIFKSASFHKKTWIVSMEVGLLNEDIMVVKIDAETGKILGYDHLLSY